MQFRPLVAVAAALVLVAACSSGGASTAPSVEAPEAPSVEASVEASAPAAEAPCVASAAGGEIDVAIADFTFDPADIQATVGQTVTFTNNDSAPHTATLDDDSCTTAQIANGGSEGLTFNVAGTYPFHCNVHPNMKGTITVS
jgi:plastocyanin